MPTAKTPKLRPCPFCGSTRPKRIGFGTPNLKWIQCRNNCCAGKGGDSYDEGGVIDLWNRRTADADRNN